MEMDFTQDGIRRRLAEVADRIGAVETAKAISTIEFDSIYKRDEDIGFSALAHDIDLERILLGYFSEYDDPEVIVSGIMRLPDAEYRAHFLSNFFNDINFGDEFSIPTTIMSGFDTTGAYAALEALRDSSPDTREKCLSVLYDSAFFTENPDTTQLAGTTILDFSKSPFLFKILEVMDNAIVSKKSSDFLRDISAIIYSFSSSEHFLSVLGNIESLGQPTNYTQENPYLSLRKILLHYKGRIGNIGMDYITSVILRIDELSKKFGEKNLENGGSFSNNAEVLEVIKNAFFYTDDKKLVREKDYSAAVLGNLGLIACRIADNLGVDNALKELRKVTGALSDAYESFEAEAVTQAFYLLTPSTFIYDEFVRIKDSLIDQTHKFQLMRTSARILSKCREEETAVKVADAISAYKGHRKQEEIIIDHLATAINEGDRAIYKVAKHLYNLHNNPILRAFGF